MKCDLVIKGYTIAVVVNIGTVAYSVEYRDEGFISLQACFCFTNNISGGMRDQPTKYVESQSGTF